MYQRKTNIYWTFHRHKMTLSRSEQKLLEIYKKRYSPPNDWKESKLGEKTKLEQPKGIPSYPFIQFDGENVTDEELLERGNLLTDLKKQIVVSPELERLRLEESMTEPDRTDPDMVEILSRPEKTGVHLNIKLDPKSYEFAKYDRTKLVSYIDKSFKDNNEEKFMRKFHNSIQYHLGYKLLLLKQDFEMHKRKIRSDIDFELKEYTRHGKTGKYVNRFTFNRALAQMDMKTIETKKIMVDTHQKQADGWYKRTTVEMDVPYSERKYFLDGIIKDEKKYNLIFSAYNIDSEGYSKWKHYAGQMWKKYVQYMSYKSTEPKPTGSEPLNSDEPELSSMDKMPKSPKSPQLPQLPTLPRSDSVASDASTIVDEDSALLPDDVPVNLGAPLRTTQLNDMDNNISVNKDRGIVVKADPEEAKIIKNYLTKARDKRTDHLMSILKVKDDKLENNMYSFTVGNEEYILKVANDTKKEDIVVTEYHGENLYDAMKVLTDGQGFAAETRASITDHLTQALRNLHDIGFLHRDIKLENVAWDGKEATLLDFGKLEEIVDGKATSDTVAFAFTRGTLKTARIQDNIELLDRERILKDSEVPYGTMKPIGVESDTYQLATMLVMLAGKGMFHYQGRVTKFETKFKKAFELQDFKTTRTNLMFTYDENNALQIVGDPKEAIDEKIKLTKQFWKAFQDKKRPFNLTNAERDRIIGMVQDNTSLVSKSTGASSFLDYDSFSDAELDEFDTNSEPFSEQELMELMDDSYDSVSDMGASYDSASDVDS